MIKKVFPWFAVIVWMCVIFSFSAQPAKKSDKTSTGTIKKVASVISPKFRKLPKTEKNKKAEKYNHIARKTAHFSEYAVLGMLCFAALGTYCMKKKKRVLMALAISALYAVTDEMHQIFVPGRACRFFDILIDSGGALTGIIILAVIVMAIERRKYDRNNKTCTGQE